MGQFKAENLLAKLNAVAANHRDGVPDPAREFTLPELRHMILTLQIRIDILEASLRHRISRHDKLAMRKL